MKKISKVVSASLCLLALTGCAVNNKQEVSQSQGVVSQETTTDFELMGVDGKMHKLSDYKGKKVYIKFWASWCSICLASLEETDLLAGEAEDFVVLSIVAPNYRNEKNVEDFKKWYATLGYEHLPVLLDEDGKVMQAFGIRAYPSSAIVDTNGNVVNTSIGHIPAEEIKAKIAETE